MNNGTFLLTQMQMVHYNAKYKSFEDAVRNRDGIIILAFLYVVSHQLPSIMCVMGNGQSIICRLLLSLVPINLKDEKQSSFTIVHLLI